MLKRLAVCLGLLATLTGAASGETLFVQGKGAALLASPAFNAAHVSTVSSGSEVNVVEKRGLWLKVNAAGKEGWLPKLLLSTRPPVAATTVFTADQQVGGDNARRRASAATTAGATRGLTAEDRKRAGANLRLGMRQLEQVDKQSVDPQEALTFVEKGVAR